MCNWPLLVTVHGSWCAPFLQALRLLNNMKIDGNLLLARVDQKTQAIFDQYVAKKKEEAAAAPTSESQPEQGELVQEVGWHRELATPVANVFL